MIDKSKWSQWYVLRSGGNGVRLWLKPEFRHGGAGGQSQMISVRRYEFEVSKTKRGLSIVRFHPAWVKRNQGILEKKWTLEEWKIAQIPPGTQKLEGWF